MKKLLALIIINIVLLKAVYNVTNENSSFNDSTFELNKTFVDSNNYQNRIVLYGDYSVEMTICEEECEQKTGTFSVNDNKIEINIADELYYFVINDNKSFSNDNYSFITE